MESKESWNTARSMTAIGRKQPSADVQADGGASTFSIIGQGVIEASGFFRQCPFERAARRMRAAAALGLSATWLQS